MAVETVFSAHAEAEAWREDRYRRLVAQGVPEEQARGVGRHRAGSWP